jgi:secreted PhoX family phosphatase
LKHIARPDSDLALLGHRGAGCAKSFCEVFFQSLLRPIAPSRSRRALLGGIAGGAFTAAAARAQSALGGAPASQAPTPGDTVGSGFNRIVLARWGDAVLPTAPPFDPNPLTGEQADTQFPYDAVLAGMVAPPPAQDGIPRLVMVTLDPSVPARMVFPGGVDIPDVAGRLQGVTVLNLQYLAGRWVTVDGGYQCRRLSDGTLCQISGPVAGNIGATVQGILGAQAGCVSPSGTMLLAEGDAAPWLARLANAGFGFNDPADAPRFGWVVEFDPLDPGSFPVKRTALGRMARSGIAATQTSDGRPVVFFSEDAPAGCFFRFIGADNAMDSGTISVAQINLGDLDWVDLPYDVPTLAGLAGAARNAGGAPFDAPGGIAIAPGNAAIYLACAGNPARQPEETDALNPRAGDDNGHILVFTPPGGDVTAKTFGGNLAIAAGNPATAAFTQYTPGSNVWFTKPRTLDLDPAGQLWIGTDQSGAVSATADGMFIMQTGGPSPFLLSNAYLAPIGAAMGGAAFDPVNKTVFCCVRHPGATPSASFNFPATRWPTLQPGMPPQTTVIGLVALP